MNRRLFPALLALILSISMIGAACTKPGNQELHSTPESSTMEPTAIPTEEPTQTPKPTPEPTPPFTALVPENTELDEHDFNAVRSFLEIKDENGVRNGEKLNKWYDPDDPATWFYLTKNEYGDDVCYSIAYWNIDGVLEEFYIPQRKEGLGGEYSSLDFWGELDLSNCTSLDGLYFHGSNHINSLNIDGCSITLLMIEDATELKSISPAKVEINQCRVANTGLTEFCWIYDFRDDFLYSDFDATVKVDGAGSFVIDGMRDGWMYMYIQASPDEGHKFIGWFDENGKLVSKDESLTIFEEDNPEWMSPQFEYTARFE